MTPTAIFYPVCALAFFTGVVGFRMFLGRAHAMRTKRIHPEALKDGTKWDETFRESENFSDAFTNLFEIPVLFYVLALSVFVTRQSDVIYVVGAWLFVFFRVTQGYIHCTSNVIRVRALSFGLGCLVIFALWIRFALHLLMT